VKLTYARPVVASTTLITRFYLSDLARWSSLLQSDYRGTIVCLKSWEDPVMMQVWTQCQYEMMATLQGDFEEELGRACSALRADIHGFESTPSNELLPDRNLDRSLSQR